MVVMLYLMMATKPCCNDPPQFRGCTGYLHQQRVRCSFVGLMSRRRCSDESGETEHSLWHTEFGVTHARRNLSKAGKTMFVQVSIYEPDYELLLSLAGRRADRPRQVLPASCHPRGIARTYTNRHPFESRTFGSSSYKSDLCHIDMESFVMFLHGRNFGHRKNSQV